MALHCVASRAPHPRLELIMQAFKLNKLFVATALALAFGPAARVVEAASLCGIPGASQMGMGCGGNTGTADSTLVPNVGAAPAQPSAPWAPGGGNTISGFLAENAGRTIQIYDGGYYDTMNPGYLSFSQSAVSFVPQMQVVPGSGDWNGMFLPFTVNNNQSATALSPTGGVTIAGQYPSQGSTAFYSTVGGSYAFSLTPSSVTIAPGGHPAYQQSSCNGVTTYGGFCTINQDMLNAGYDVYNALNGYLYGPGLAPLACGVMTSYQPSQAGCGGG